LVLFGSLAPNFSVAKAADTSTWYNQDFFGWYDKVYNTNTSPTDQIFGERYTAAQVQWIIYGLVSIPINFLGSTAQPVAQCFLGVLGNVGDIVTCGTNTITFIQSTVNTLHTVFGISQTNSNQPPLTQLFNAKERPLSGIGYVERLATKFSPVTNVHAQTGFGYTALGSIQQYWVGFRNMAFAIIVLVTIIFAFMIMFRVKLNPQTVVSVQSALPKIVIALILATFSYAIAGFLVDLTYVVSGLFASLVHFAGFASSASEAYSYIVPSGGFGSFYIFFFMLFYWIVFAFAVLWSIACILIGNFSLFGGIVAILSIFIWVWLLVLVIWYTIKIPWILIKNLISIYISIVIAPLQIVAGTIVPSFGFGQWLRKLIAELMVFPVAGLLMYLAWVTLLNSFAVNAAATIPNWIAIPLFGVPTKLWAPEIIGSTGNMSGLIWVLVSFGILTTLPNVVKYMKQFIMGEKFTSGSAMGTITGLAGVGGGLTETYALNKYETAKTAGNVAAMKRWGNVAKVGQYAQTAAKNIPH
jgi:hypothetical protein